MGQLNGDRHVGPASHALERPAYRGFGFIVPQADVGMADPSLGHYGRCLDGQQGRARKREVPEMDEMQSVMHPSMAEYWHMGAMTMRFASSRPPTFSGVNNTLTADALPGWLSPFQILPETTKLPAIVFKAAESLRTTDGSPEWKPAAVNECRPANSHGWQRMSVVP